MTNELHTLSDLLIAITHAGFHVSGYEPSVARLSNHELNLGFIDFTLRVSHSNTAPTRDVWLNFAYCPDTLTSAVNSIDITGFDPTTKPLVDFFGADPGPIINSAIHWLRNQTIADVL